MARLQNKMLFFTTSPRTPLRMVEPIHLLVNEFTGEKWNNESQTKFMKMLVQDESYEGNTHQKDPAFSARDKINRAPKSLGFVDLNPKIEITKPGQLLIDKKRQEEVLLRQLLKFQLPSPFHTVTEYTDGTFWIKPYLEIIRLTYILGKLTFDEMVLFGLKLTDFRLFDNTVDEIYKFRKEKELYPGGYKKIFNDTFDMQLSIIYQKEIKSGKFKIRESSDKSYKKFRQTKLRNHRDYTDACFRYLRSTGLLQISHKGRSLSISDDKLDEVEYILNSIERNPVFTDNTALYKEYLFDEKIPALFTDNVDNVIDYILKYGQLTKRDLLGKSIEELKDLKDDVILRNKERILSAQVKELKSYALYSEVIDTYNEIISSELYDIPLMLEWNTWRAMTMLNGGSITGNFKVDDTGRPMSTAIGNVADIICDYGDFGLTVEVTMQSGQRQYETEGEPVARHLAKYKKIMNKECYCIFIAPKINEATIAHFYTLSKTNIGYYGGKSMILPLPLETFMTMIENSYVYPSTPTSYELKELFDYAIELSDTVSDESEWYEKILQKASCWCTGQ